MVGGPSGARPAVPRLEWESTGTRTVVGVQGDLDAQLEAFVAGSPLVGCRVLEVDLGGVPSIGSVGLVGPPRRAPVDACSAASTLRLRGMQPSVWRVFELTGLDGAFAPTVDLHVPPAVQELTLF